MAINWDLFKIFCVIAKYQNISKAAAILNITQPTMTTKLQKLEAQTGLSLFNRHSWGVSLTSDGKYLYEKINPYVNGIMKVEEEVESLSQLESGLIRINFNNRTSQYALQTVIDAFLKEHPNIIIQPSTIPRNALHDAINSGLIDIAFACRPEVYNIIPPGESAEHFADVNDDVTEYSLGIFSGILMVHNHLFPETKGLKSMADLRRFPMVFLRRRDRAEIHRILNPDEAYSDMRSKDLLIDDINAIFHLLKISNYVAFLPELSTTKYDNGEFRRISVPDLPPVKLQYLMIHSKIFAPRLAAKKLIDFVLEDKAFTPEITKCYM